MLDAFRKGSGRAMLRLGVAVAAVLGLSTGGCSAVESGEHEQHVSFLVVPQGGTFSGWTDITLGEDIDQFGSAELWGVTLSVMTPPTVTDLSFFSTLTATAKGTTVATQSEFPRGAPSVDLHLDYLGDLHPLFESQTEIRITWTGSLNPAFNAWPADNAGIWVQGEVVINLD
jgi:hypothetical protein